MKYISLSPTMACVHCGSYDVIPDADIIAMQRDGIDAIACDPGDMLLGAEFTCNECGKKWGVVGITLRLDNGMEVEV